VYISIVSNIPTRDVLNTFASVKLDPDYGHDMRQSAPGAFDWMTHTCVNPQPLHLNVGRIYASIRAEGVDEILWNMGAIDHLIGVTPLFWFVTTTLMRWPVWPLLIKAVNGPHFEARPGPSPAFIFETRIRPESQIYRMSLSQGMCNCGVSKNVVYGHSCTLTLQG